MIDINKQYRTREGHAARILATDVKGKYPVVAVILSVIDGSEKALEFPANGFWLGETPHPYDLIEYNPAKDLVVDQPIWVRDRWGDWLPLHFSHCTEDGKVHCFPHGMTSHTGAEMVPVLWEIWSATRPLNTTTR